MGNICAREEEHQQQDDLKENPNQIRHAQPAPPVQAETTEVAPSQPEPDQLIPERKAPGPTETAVEVVIPEAQTEWIQTKEAINMNASVKKAFDKLKRDFRSFSDLKEHFASPIDRLINSTTGNIYEGHVVRGSPHGWGVLYTKKGDLLEGVFNNGKPQSHLRLITADGLDYIGDLKDEQRHGRGTLTKPDGSSQYCATWVNGHVTGEVEERDERRRLVFRGRRNAKGLIEGLCTVGRQGFVVQGSFKDGVPEGVVKKIYDDSRLYEGTLNKDFIEEGEGTLTYVDGRKFKGPFARGLPNGKGTLISDTGKTSTQTFKDGKRI